MTLPLPPSPQGQSGLRALKALMRHRNILAALETLHHDMGNVFRLSLAGFKPVVLVGPEANRFVLMNQVHDLRWRMEQDPVTKLLQHGLLVVDGTEHDSLRSVMNPALHRTMLVNYANTMISCTDRITNTWTTGQKVDMLPELRRIALLILMQCLFSTDFAPRLESMWPAILRTLNYISPGAWLFWPDIPRPGYRRAIQQVEAYLLKLIRDRRIASDPGDDLLGLLIRTPGLCNIVIKDQLLTMIVAGHDTSTALMAWTLYLTGQQPEVMARLQAEVDDGIGSARPNYQSVNRLSYLDQVLKEVLRMYPPVHTGMRIAAVDLEFQGYAIPAGTRLMYSIYLSHRQPDIWPQSNQFDPERFRPEQHRLRPPQSYIPFGGGARNCIGAAFGLIEAKMVLTRILQHFTLKLTCSNVKPHMGATLEPRPGVTMQLHRRSYA